MQYGGSPDSSGATSGRWSRSRERVSWRASTDAVCGESPVPQTATCLDSPRASDLAIVRKPTQGGSWTWPLRAPGLPLVGFEGLRVLGVGWAENRGSTGFLWAGSGGVGGNSGMTGGTVIGSRCAALGWSHGHLGVPSHVGAPLFCAGRFRQQPSGSPLERLPVCQTRCRAVRFPQFRSSGAVRTLLSTQEREHLYYNRWVAPDVRKPGHLRADELAASRRRRICTEMG